MEKLFISYKLALKLQELGFNEVCLTYYNYDSFLERSDDWAFGVTMEYKRERNQCLAPTWQQAFDFMSTKFGMHGNIFRSGKNGEYQSFEYTKGYGGTASNGETYNNIYKCRTDLLKHLIKYK